MLEPIVKSLIELMFLYTEFAEYNAKIRKIISKAINFAMEIVKYYILSKIIDSKLVILKAGFILI